jgi:uncharacterized protein
MKKNYIMILMLAAISLVSIMSLSALAQSKDEITTGMRDRYQALQQAKDKGFIGEAWTGLVVLVDSNAPGDIQNLVSAENKDRVALFQIIARETGTSVEEVARQNRIRMYRLAEDNHFLQDQNRQWVRKRDLSL